MSEGKLYELKLLTEESASEDLFEDKTHQQISETLYKVIQNGNSEGVTIGLEGSWGSGKSTVISILKQKLESDPNTIYFYFDAWAHEGDPLRRVFLEAMIDQVDPEDSILQDLKSRISNRKKTSNIKSIQTVTALGKKLAFSTLFVPLGAAIISNTASKIVFGLNSEIYWVFLFGLICAIAPLSVLANNGWNLWKAKRDLTNPKDWMFLQGETENVTTQEVSEDDERSSIEFEQYFREILDVVFSKKKNAKLLIVVDNLDRVDADDSLKIWSTLQTFLQRRNPTDTKSICFKKIWVIVPYDEDGLAKLWKNRSDNLTDNNHNNTLVDTQNNSNRDCAKSFFDKCFQLRIEVPKLILTGWESFCKKNIDQALIGWEENNKNDIINILKWTRESVNDIPTPREIKTYVNQVGLLRLHCDKNISTLAIAYFAVQKYIIFRTNAKIERLILSGELPLSNHKPIFPNNLTSEICGILYGVSAEKGHQLLLEPEIEKALNTKNISKITELSEIHKTAFWTVFNLHLPKMIDIGKTTHYSFVVMNSLWKLNSNKCWEFISYLKAALDGFKSLEIPSQNDLDDYMSMFTLLDEGEYSFTNLWSYVINSLNVKMKKGDIDYLSSSKIICSLAKCQKHKSPQPYTLSELPIENWIKWAQANSTEESDIYNLVKPHKSIIKEIGAKITPGVAIPEGLSQLIYYIVRGGENQWESVITALQSHIEWNQGTPSGNILSIEIYNILKNLSACGPKALKALEQILKNGPFYNLTYQLNSNGSVKYAALLLAKCLPKEIDTLQIGAIVNSNDGLQLVRSFWKTNNVDNAQFVWSEIKLNNDFELIWVIANDIKNILIGDIIKTAVNENCADLFKITKTLIQLKTARILTGNDNTFNNMLTKCFTAYGNIEHDILESNNLDVIAYSQELYLIVENSDDVKIAEYLTAKLNTVSKDQWDKALKDDSYLTTLAIAIKNKSTKIKLGDNIYDSLLSYLQLWTSNGVVPSDALRDEIVELISMLKTSFKTQLENRLASHLIDLDFKANYSAVSYIINYINIQKVISDGSSKIQDVLEDYIKKSDIDSLKIINLILSHKDSSTFIPAQHLSEVFQAPMIELLEADDGSNKLLIESLAAIFKVDLTKSPEPVEAKDDIQTNLTTS